MKTIWVLIVFVFFASNASAESVKERLRKARLREKQAALEDSTRPSKELKKVKEEVKKNLEDEKKENPSEKAASGIETITDGVVPFYDKTGRLIREEVYKNGEMIEQIAYQTNGRMAKFIYKDGKYDHRELYDKDGNLVPEKDWTEAKKKSREALDQEMERREKEQIELGLSDEEYAEKIHADQIKEADEQLNKIREKEALYKKYRDSLKPQY